MEKWYKKLDIADEAMDKILGGEGVEEDLIDEAMNKLDEYTGLVDRKTRMDKRKAETIICGRTPGYTI